MGAFIGRQLDRGAYLVLWAVLQAGYTITRLLAAVRWRRPDAARPLDLALFPYYPPGYPGYDARFGNYLPLLERDAVRFQLHPPADGAQALDVLLAPRRRQRYRFYRNVYWRRLRQLWQARVAKVAFVQRGLFPYYPDQAVPHLERLLRRLVPHTIVDFYDADYVASPAIVEGGLRYFDKVTVVNAHLEARFRKVHPHVSILPLTLEVGGYAVKQDYALHDPVRLFWVGNPGNAVKLALVQPVLARLSRRRRLELAVVCREPVTLEGIEVSWQRLDHRELCRFMPTVDIALYVAEEVEADRGKMALKVLEYMAAGLPVVASPQGLSSAAVHEESLIVAEDDPAWEAALLRLMDSEPLRRRLGAQARVNVAREHSPTVCYPRLREILFG